MPEETKKEREKRLNRDRQERYRERQRLRDRIAGQETNRDIIIGATVDDERDLNMQMMDLELEQIRDHCEDTGTPIWASERYKDWEKRMDDLEKKGQLPKKRRRRRGKGVKIFPLMEDY